MPLARWGENHFALAPTAIYGLVLLMAAIAYWILQYSIVATDAQNSDLKATIGSDLKGKGSIVLYSLAIMLSFWAQTISQIIYIAVAMLWVVPDRRIGKLID